jgi:Family of unknown function (DUF6056)
MEQDLRRTPGMLSPELRARILGAGVWLGVTALLYAFLLTMARYEPITGDGWYNADDLKAYGSDLSSMLERLRHLHNHSNPRIGQLFTMLSYQPGMFHVAVTPLVLLMLFFLVFVHAMGRMPRMSSRHDAAMFLLGSALCWLGSPQPGQAFFYRPITTNYVYTLALALLLFLPFRLARPFRLREPAVAAAIGIFPFSLFIGKTNEHTGPTLIAAALAYTLAAFRRRDLGNACWMASTTVGLLIGYLFLFFAPGQSQRYGDLGRQSVVQTIIGRGLLGNLQLIGELCSYLGPMLLLLGVLTTVYCIARGDDAAAADITRSRLWGMAGYVLAAAMVAGTSLAAPKNQYRLFIAPAVLLAIAGVTATDIMSHVKIVQRLSALASIATNLGFAWILLGVYREIHEDDLVRTALVRAARPGDMLLIPRLRHAKRDPLFYGDSLIVDPRHRQRMAHLYDLAEVRVERPSPAQMKKRKKPQAARLPPVSTDDPAIDDGASLDK